MKEFLTTWLRVLQFLIKPLAMSLGLTLIIVIFVFVTLTYFNPIIALILCVLLVIAMITTFITCVELYT